MLFFIVLASSYFIFLFVGESINPFMAPSGHVKRVRWQLGWFSTIVHIFSACAAILIAQMWSLDPLLLLLIYVTVSLVCYGVGKIVQRVIQNRSYSSEKQINTVTSAKDDYSNNLEGKGLANPAENLATVSPTRKLDTRKYQQSNQNHKEKPGVSTPDITL